MAKPATFSPAQGFVAESDIKEDEEQSVKFAQTVDLLLAAGYFRARIKGLSPFDKVVGGMTWCITTCTFDVDVDLLFQENSTIGQKIALTEKIVAVLPRMKCPHRIEPHQIQGLDFIHIFPVVQWLVKRAIETREEMGDYIRSYSASQFDKHHTMPEDLKFYKLEKDAVDAVGTVNFMYGPERKYKRHDSSSLDGEEMRIQSTLLEYGKKYAARSKVEKIDSIADKKAAVAGTHRVTEEEEEKKRQEEEERRMNALMSGLTVTDHTGSKVTANAVGSIVGLQSEQIQEMASQYAEKQAELEKLEKSSPKLSGVQHHKRMVNSLQKQIQQKEVQMEDIEKAFSALKTETDDIQQRLQNVEDYGAKLDEETKKLSQLETEENCDVLQKLQHLVAMNENLKRQEQEFRAHCKEEMERLQGEINKLNKETDLDDGVDSERKQLIDRQLTADQEKLNKIRIVLARKNREISILQRKIDEVPTRTELSQYQRRFVELYNQIATKHKETKQFYTLHNTLDDTKLYLNKEVNLLNSIHDTFEQAMSSPANKEQFLKQFEQIVEGVKLNRNKLEKKKQEEKMRRDQLNDHHLDLVEKQRVYYKTVKDFQEECRKNEIILSKMKRV